MKSYSGKLQLGWIIDVNYVRNEKEGGYRMCKRSQKEAWVSERGGKIRKTGEGEGKEKGGEENGEGEGEASTLLMY